MPNYDPWWHALLVADVLLTFCVIGYKHNLVFFPISSYVELTISLSKPEIQTANKAYP